MFRTHTTKNGKSMLICQMRDRHLLNTINAILRQMEECNGVINSRELREDKLFAHMTGQTNAYREQVAIKRFRELHDKLPHYILEAAVRNIINDEMIENLEEAYGRGSRVIPVTDINLEETVDGDDDYGND